MVALIITTLCFIGACAAVMITLIKLQKEL